MGAEGEGAAAGGGGNQNNNNNRKRKHQHYLPHNRPVRRKGSNPLRPGLQGFFITCDGGKEHQAAHEAINVIDSFFEELVHGKAEEAKLFLAPNKTLNKKIKFSYSDSSNSEGDDDEDDDEDEVKKVDKEDNKSETIADGATVDTCPGNGKPDHQEEDTSLENQRKETTQDDKQDVERYEGSDANDTLEPPSMKQCSENKEVPKRNPSEDKAEKSIDKLIEAELEELADKSKRRFGKCDSGCNGVVFIHMQKRDGDPGPKEIVQHIMEAAASTRKHMSSCGLWLDVYRFLLRVLPIELTCYSSEEEISKAIKPVIAHHFPTEAEKPIKFAVLYDARANSGIDRMKIIDAVAKTVPCPHKVDLKVPEKTIVVQIVKTICLIGIVEKYKELAKYNLRQLTSPKG
ncbi:THUMP domain-containing protein [Drosera capensis]